MYRISHEIKLFVLEAVENQASSKYGIVMNIVEVFLILCLNQKVANHSKVPIRSQKALCVLHHNSMNKKYWHTALHLFKVLQVFIYASILHLYITITFPLKFD